MSTKAPPRSVKPPSRLHTALEARALSERMAMAVADPLLGRLPSGDGHDVIVLPGFLADDRSTEALRDLLGRLGYRVHPWGLGRNLGPTSEIVEGLGRLFAVTTADGRRVSIVGWSLGGIYGRELARRSPGSVRQVITLGSPIHMMGGVRARQSGQWDDRSGDRDPELTTRRIPERERGPLPVPTTSVYTRTDGIVHWSTCLIERGPRAENVEIRGSHCGLGFNPAAVAVVADRLAQRDGEWRRFRAPRWAQRMYPRPVDRRPGS